MDNFLQAPASLTDHLFVLERVIKAVPGQHSRLQELQRPMTDIADSLSFPTTDGGIGRTMSGGADGLIARLAEDYRSLLMQVCGAVTSDAYEAAVELVEAPAGIRGYGHVRSESIRAFQVLQKERLTAYRAALESSGL